MKFAIEFFKNLKTQISVFTTGNELSIKNVCWQKGIDCSKHGVNKILKFIVIFSDRSLE